MPRSRKSMMEVLRERLRENRAKHHIDFEMDVERYIKEVEDGKQAAKLAQDTGWDVLDVEEVRDIFLAFAPNGTINVSSAAFMSLLKQLYSGSGAEELMSICEEFAAQGIGGGRNKDDEDLSDSDSDTDVLKSLNYEIAFRDFFMALTTWLNRQDKATTGRRCTLKRFEAPDAEALKSLAVLAADPPERRTSLAGFTTDPLARRTSLRGATIMAGLMEREYVCGDDLSSLRCSR